MDVEAEIARMRSAGQLKEATVLAIESYGPGVLTFLEVMLRAHADTADAFAQACEDLWRGLPRFEGRSSLRTWVFSILVNRARTRGERERRSVPFASLAREETDGDFAAVDPERFVGAGNGAGAWVSPPVRWWEEPERALASDEAVERIESEIAKLPEMQRLVITMRDVEGLSSEEVRSALDISETNQRVLLHRARSKVRAALEDYYADA